MSIKTREDANKYYHLVNELVDDYIDKWKIKPSNLGRYLSPGSDRFNKFLTRNKLNDISGSDRILKDVIEDRINMEKDGILTFESYKLFESDEFKMMNLKNCLTKGIEKADIEMEKILADFFDTNLGHIDIVDADKHMFKIDDNWNGSSEFNCIIYSNSDIELIKENILDFVYEELSQKKIDISGINVGLEGLFSKEVLNSHLNRQFSREYVVDLVSEILGHDFQLTNSKAFHIWTSSIM